MERASGIEPLTEYYNMSINLIVEDDMILMIKQHKFDAFGHGANCQNVMGAGIAAQIKLHFPEMFTADKLGHKQAGRGGFTKAPINVRFLHNVKPVIGYNLYTQYRLGRDADEHAVHDALSKALLDAELNTEIDKMCIPMIGAGIGGLTSSQAIRAFNKAYQTYIKTKLGKRAPIKLYVVIRKEDAVKLSPEERRDILDMMCCQGFIDYEGNNVQI